jgi:hypothetical protein
MRQAVQIPDLQSILSGLRSLQSKRVLVSKRTEMSQKTVQRISLFNRVCAL